MKPRRVALIPVFASVVAFCVWTAAATTTSKTTMAN